MTKDALKGKIIKKFGTMSHFARCAGMDRLELQRWFACNTLTREDFSQMKARVDGTEFREKDDRIPPEKVEALKEAIKKVGSIPGFCSDNPDFPIGTVKEVVYGKRTRMTEKVAKLFAHFNI